MHKYILFLFLQSIINICCSKIPILELDALKTNSYYVSKNVLLKDSNENSENAEMEETQDTNTSVINKIKNDNNIETSLDKITDKINNATENNLENKQRNLDRHLEKLESIFNTKFTNNMNQLKITPPQFMTDLYESTKYSSDFIHGIPVVKAYLEQDPSTQGIFLFDLDDYIKDEDITEAELHVYRTALDNQDVNYHSPYYLLRVYQIMPMPRYQYSISPDVHQLLNVHYISAFSFGWQVFKVKRAVDSWRNGTLPNLGLLVTATTIFGDPVEVKFARRGLYSDQLQPSLVVYNKNLNEISGQLNSHLISKRTLNYIEDPEKFITNINKTIGGCQRVSHKINFENIGLDFILAPQEYDAYACNKADKCGENLIMNGYTYIRNMINNYSLTCVPVKFGSLPVLYFDMKLKVTYTILPAMVVTKCECR